jgi:hypothetical protein
VKFTAQLGHLEKAVLVEAANLSAQERSTTAVTLSDSFHAWFENFFPPFGDIITAEGEC